MKANEYHVLKSLYPASVLLKAAFSFIDRAYVRFTEDPESWIVTLSPKDNCVCTTLCEEFENELITQVVRQQIYDKTHSLRDMLMARAMTSTLVNEDDPIMRITSDQSVIPGDELEEILKSWFDKYE